jgi:hypothetical protein
VQTSGRRARKAYHLSDIVDAESIAGPTAQRAEVGCCPAVQVYEVSTVHVLCGGRVAKTQACKKHGEKDAAEVESRNCFHVAPLAVFDVFKNDGMQDYQKNNEDRLKPDPDLLLPKIKL